MSLRSISVCQAGKSKFIFFGYKDIIISLMSKKFFLNMVMFTVLFSILMYLFPQIDLTISSWFYNPSKGFILENAYEKLHLAVFRDCMVYLTYLLIIGLTITLIAGIFFKKYSSL